MSGRATRYPPELRGRPARMVTTVTAAPKTSDGRARRSRVDVPACEGSGFCPQPTLRRGSNWGNSRNAQFDLPVAVRQAQMIATGHSEFPNQINKVLAFLGLFLGAVRLRCSARGDEAGSGPGDGLFGSRSDRAGDRAECGRRTPGPDRPHPRSQSWSDGSHFGQESPLPPFRWLGCTTATESLVGIRCGLAFPDPNGASNVHDRLH